ncbi:Uncharacterised protein [Sebaldella termitidis]|uniref:Uncharacterized protein n=1 Tax=Sebaldella termitidis (strain ATCC 33386 / NCTC 11300) TaxID=526218 RepID=D1AGM6_SEBTE|nr:hypothetical protein [Sebaldella termitidis]ACZ10746.1 hypothetical protein Sterm_3913 [Sebaldella termitidis ATCC 33386]SUI26089.1 Uncharacterised protein [Sebaldella termitidis]
MNREFLESLFDETYEIVYANSEEAIMLRRKIVEKIEILKSKEITKISIFDLNLQGLVTDKLQSFFMGNINIFKEIYGLDEDNKAEMITALKNHSEKIVNDFIDNAPTYESNLKEFIELKEKFRPELNEKKRAVFKEYEDLQTEREAFILELKFEVMLKISEFLYNIDKIKKIDFMIEKKTPEETEV